MKDFKKGVAYVLIGPPRPKEDQHVESEHTGEHMFWNSCMNKWVGKEITFNGYQEIDDKDVLTFKETDHFVFLSQWGKRCGPLVFP